MAAPRVTGHLKLLDRREGPVWFTKTRVPGRTPEQTTRRLAPAHLGGGKPAAGSLTRRQAQDALADLLAVERAKVGGGAYDRGQSTATFTDAAREYLRFVEDVRKRDQSTVADYRGVIDGYLLDEFGERTLDSITADDIDRYKERLLDERRLSNRTIVRHLTVLHGIFKRARRAFKLKENPASAEMVERPPVVYTGEYDTYSWDEIELLAAHAETAQDAELYRVAAFTGLRQGELLALRWRDVEFVGGLVHVRRNFTNGVDKIPKGKKVRSVPMVPDVLDALARLKDRELFCGEDDLVFCSPTGGYLNHDAMRTRYYGTVKRAGLRRLRFHDLRHAFASVAITRLDGYAVQSYMGHAHYSTTQRYLHHKPRAADALALHEAFRETVSPTVSRTGDIDGNSAQQGDAEAPETTGDALAA